MAGFNKVMLIGNLTGDVELKRIPSGVPVADFRVAVSEKSKNKNGEVVDKPMFIDVVVWDRQAETCAEYLGKGSQVMIEGRLQHDTWTTKEGEKKSKHRVRAEMVQFLGAPRQGGTGRPVPSDSDESPRGGSRPSASDDAMPLSLDDESPF